MYYQIKMIENSRILWRQIILSPSGKRAKTLGEKKLYESVMVKIQNKLECAEY